MLLTGTEAQLAHQPGVAGAEPVAELGDERLQVLAPLLRRVDVPEEIPQGIGQELVTEVVEGHQLVQDVPPAHTNKGNIVRRVIKVTKLESEQLLLCSILCLSTHFYLSSFFNTFSVVTGV